MPSPVGHALGGLIAGWLVAPPVRPVRPGSASARWRSAVFAALAVAPDLDLLFGTHSTYTHSVGAVMTVGLAALAATAFRNARLALACAAARNARLALACAAAWGSHLVLDWLGADSTPPLGIMALWPFTDAFYQSRIAVFDAISRRYWLADFYRQNTLAVARELLILGPMTWLAWRSRTRRARRPT